MRVLLIGPFDVFTGYGSDLVGLARAMNERGFDVVPYPTSVMAGLPMDVARMFAKDPRGRYDLGIVHTPPFQLKASDHVRRACSRLVGWTMWERTEFSPPDDAELDWSPFDLMLCYDGVTLEALRAYDDSVPMRVLQGGVDESAWPYMERDWFGKFGFLMLGELHARKDPWVAIDAYRELREDGELEDSVLQLKTSVPTLHPEIEKLIPGVKIHGGYWPREKVLDLYRESHVLLAPSRGEGKNLPALEMQLTGAPVIATAWGGHTTWLHPEYSWPLAYELHPAEPGGVGFQARASKDHLKDLMVTAYEDREEARRKGKVASGAIRSTHSWGTVLQRLVQDAMADR